MSQGTRTAVTTDDGRYFIPYLTPGTYEITAELQGFKTARQRGIAVRLGQRADLSLELEVGGITETVQVEGGAQVVDTTSASAGTNLDSETLARIPVGRRFSDTLCLARRQQRGRHGRRESLHLGGAAASRTSTSSTA